MKDGYLFAVRPMLGIGTITSSEDWAGRIEDFHDFLRDQFPLGQLRASVVRYDYSTTASGVEIRAFLQRAPQGVLWPSVTEEFASDPFDMDVRTIKESARNLEEDFEDALKGCGDPALDPSLARRRALIDRCSPEGRIPLYTTPEGKFMPLGCVRTYMDHAPEFEAVFGVEVIRRNVCRVLDLDLKVPTDAPPALREIRMANLQGKIDLHREERSKGEVAGAVFSKSLETGVPLRARVQLAFSWVDGTPKRWSIDDLPEFLG
ncbi:hypothetical protein [Hydrogenophaga sp.]|uniref:hypothetical protein n=1 Tax=Hydrogenophaga sp. TaxID=1904254 RepID=UPI00272BD478|nr:hypothetical protein [Hydrogenophaga sp.]